MKSKLDENFGRTALSVFRRRGLDCDSVHDENPAGIDDPDVLAAAVSEDRVLAALDRDFTYIILNFPGCDGRGRSRSMANEPPRPWWRPFSIRLVGLREETDSGKSLNH